MQRFHTGSDERLLVTGHTVYVPPAVDHAVPRTHEERGIDVLRRQNDCANRVRGDVAVARRALAPQRAGIDAAVHDAGW
jgi:hypothetical protein